MAYIGRQLARGTNKLFDDISSSFNGSTTTFNLTVASVATSTATPYQLFVSLGGVMQKPGTDFTTAGNQITFTTAPAAGISCWIMMQGDSIDQAAIPDGVVTASKIANSGDFAFPADIRLKDSDGSHYVGFQAPTTVSTNKVWTLPAADGSANQVLTTNGSGVLTWSTVAAGVSSDAQYNTVGGTSAGAALNSTSLRNTLFGYQAGTALTDSGSSNQANDNTAVGYQALKTANGNWAVQNTAIGAYALYSSTTAQSNTAIGRYSSYGVTTGNANTTLGQAAGFSITTGIYNVVIGDNVGSSLTTGSYNLILGNQAQPSSGSVSHEITLGGTSFTKFRIPGINFVLKDNGGTPSSGQVLTADSNGEGYWAAAGGGAWEVIATDDLNSSAKGNSGAYAENRGWDNTSYRMIKAVFVGVGNTGATRGLNCRFYCGSNGSNGSIANQTQYRWSWQKWTYASTSKSNDGAVSAVWHISNYSKAYNWSGEINFPLMYTTGSTMVPVAYGELSNSDYHVKFCTSYLGSDAYNNHMVGAAFIEPDDDTWNTGKIIWMGLKV